MGAMTALIVIAAGSLVMQEGPPPFDRGKIGKPPQLMGIPLPPAAAKMVNAAGVESVPSLPSPREVESHYAGYPSADVSKDNRLVWTLDEGAKGRFYLYFLVRTGHQRGYEYVFPKMTYFVELDGRSVDMEPVYVPPAIRVFQHPDGWGYDLGWIRSKQLVQLRPGAKLAIGCTDEYAFVSLGLMATEEDARLTNTVLGNMDSLRKSTEDGQMLVQRMAEVFPMLKAGCERAQRIWEATASKFHELEAELEKLHEKIKAGEKPDTSKMAARVRDMAAEMVFAEKETCHILGPALRQAHQRLQAREQKARLDCPSDFAGREAEYARSIAEKYLKAAENLPITNIAELRKLASYCWRAEQFLTRAEAALQEARKTPRSAEKVLPPALEPRPRMRVLINGLWEMSTEGTPETPPQGGWFSIRVPHGPWSETVGRFMAPDRKWPPGQRWAWYRTRFTVPQQMAESAIFLCFDAVFHLCEAYVNGSFVGRHIGGFDKFEFDITPFVRPGEEAQVLCFVHDTSYTAIEKSQRPGEMQGVSSGPNHYAISDLWGARFGGIWQDVAIEARPALWTDEVLVMPSVRKRTLTVRSRVQAHNTLCQSARKPTFTLRQDVLRDSKVVLSLPEVRASLKAEATWHSTAAKWPNPELWGIGGEYGDPRNLYVLRTRLFVSGKDQPVDVRYDRFGFREFWIEDGHFWLNGKRLPLQGGGTWYLQESKAPHGNRWWAIRFFGLERSMNVNIERWHRHGDVADDFFDVADELGMLNEPEGPYWAVSGIPDILGYTDWDDPVWVANVTEHYQRWARKHFNHPSIVLWSVENETFCRPGLPKELLNRFLDFGDAIKQVDPTRPVTYHGSASGGYADGNPRLEIVNLHYPYDTTVANWRKKWGGRPCIDGEFQNYPPLFLMSTNNREVAAENMRKLQDWIEAKWKYYAKIELPGAFYFLPYMAGLVSTAKPEWMGPWGDLLGDPEKAAVVESGWAKGQAIMSAAVPIEWPSLSGPGIKCEQLVTGLGHLSLINWFDSSRPEATPTPVAETIARCWRPMPQLRQDTAPEVIVTVTRGGKPLSGVTVLAIPQSDQPTPIVGAVTDPAGTAWLVLQADGAYKITSGNKSVRWQAHRLPRAVKPGWEHIPRLELPLD